MRPKGVADGQQVNIPAPPEMIKSDGGTQTVSSGAQRLQTRVKGEPGLNYRFGCQEKLLGKFRRPYHKPTQVDEMNILRRSGDGMFRN